MKMRIILVAVFFTLLAVSYPVSAAVPYLCIDGVFCDRESPGTSYDSSSSTAQKSDPPLAECSRIGPVLKDVAEYRIKVNVGPGEYDYITLTNYVEEESPWHTDKDENLVILPGQGLTEMFYSDMAIYYAQRGYSVYILDRRETNIQPVGQPDEDDFSFMKDWDDDMHLSDTCEGITASRNHTSFLNGKPEENIKVTAIGHSHGALILTAYEASEYDDLPPGSVDRIVPVDIIIKYDPEHSELIKGQEQDFTSISNEIENGKYESTGMATMIEVARLADSFPNDTSPILSGFTNIQLFRLFASQTYSLSSYHPYTPDYHYWTGDFNGLYYVDENRLLSLTLNGGAVPFTPKYMDQYMAGLMGNVKGYEIDSSKIDSPVLYVGLGGGFGDYGSWWYEYEVGKTNRKVTCMNWSDQGHASLLIDRNSPELWALIYKWMKD